MIGVCHSHNRHPHLLPIEYMNYCTKCGKQLNGKEKFCTNCGNPLSPLYTNNRFQSTKKTNESSTSIWGVAFVILFIIVGIALYSSNNDNSSFNSISSAANFLKKEKSQEEIQSIKDISEMRKAINNTIWTHTKRGDLFWIKIEFKEDRVRTYRAFPSDGKWTFEEECPYTLEEGRFFDDGRRYIAAVIKTKEFSTPPKFIITNGHLSWLGFIDAGGFVLGDYEWD